MDKTSIIELAAAIARGDCKAAAEALDYVFRDRPGGLEAIAQGRNSILARPRRAKSRRR